MLAKAYVDPTLSVSMLAISSSASTQSPGFLSHVFSVPSEIDSAICGTLIVSGAVSQTHSGSASGGLFLTFRALVHAPAKRVDVWIECVVAL